MSPEGPDRSCDGIDSLRVIRCEDFGSVLCTNYCVWFLLSQYPDETKVLDHP